MFDIGASELLLIAVVAIVVIGPKDMPLALRTAGRWIAKIRRISNHFRAGVETMIREAEMEEMEKKWQEQNRQIMQRHPDADEPAAEALPAKAEGEGAETGASAEARAPAPSTSDDSPKSEAADGPPPPP